MIPAERASDPGRDDRLIVVVGPCASGKSTLVAGLRAQGYRAMVSGQEHSEIPTLWRRQKPDVTIGLLVDLATVRCRRSSAWSEEIYRRQQTRLQSAYAAADLLIDTAVLDQAETLRRAVSLLHGSPPIEDGRISLR